MPISDLPGPDLDEPDLNNTERRKLLQWMGIVSLTLLLPTPIAALARNTETPFIDKASLVRKLAGQTGLKASAIQSVLANAQFIPSIIERMNTPYESKPYAQYRPLFVTSEMEEMGRKYLQEQQSVFSHTEGKYRVEGEVVAAILGLETRFGRHHGDDRILDSLYTLASGYPRRADFFRRELGEFLLLSREEGLTPAAVLGSYAGAFGATQFIPSSFRAYAVDEDGDGKRDVWHSVSDIIASVANYFHRHGWKHHRPVAFWLPGLKKSYSKALQERASRGFNQWSPLHDLRLQLPELPDVWNNKDKVTLIEMQTADGDRLALVHYNFYVITRWNRSYNYAMATTEVAAMLGCDTCRVA